MHPALLGFPDFLLLLSSPLFHLWVFRYTDYICLPKLLSRSVAPFPSSFLRGLFSHFCKPSHSCWFHATVTLNPWPSLDASQGSDPTPSWVRTGESPGIPQDPSLSFGFQQRLSGTSEGQGTNGKTEPRAPRQIQPWVQHQERIIRAPCPFQGSGCCCYPCPPLLSPSSLSSTKSVTELTQNSGQVPNVIPGANRVQDEHRTEEQKEEARREGDAQGPALWVRTPRKTAATASPALPSIYQSPSSSSFGVSKTIKHGEHREQLQNTVLNTGKKNKVGTCWLMPSLLLYQLPRSQTNGVM